MPNRMLRDWTDSDKVNTLSVHSERFFTRLIMKVDDFGCFYADTRLLKANLFPLLLDNIREADLIRWMAECQKAGLIVLYENTGKKYVQIIDFKQRLDRAKSKYPLPIANDSLEVVNDYPPEQNRSRTEVELEVEGKSGEPQTHSQQEKDLFTNFQKWVTANAPRVNQLKEPLTLDQFLKLREKLNKETLSNLLKAMQNYKPLLSKSISAYLTILNWSKREIMESKEDIKTEPGQLSSVVAIIRESEKNKVANGSN